MRLTLAAVLAALFVSAAHADTMKNCAAVWNALSPPDKAKITYSAYSAECLKKDSTAGQAVMAALPKEEAPPGATAMCQDGTYSKSITVRGRCSSHGGIAKTL
jgi:hypothetical protein